MSQGSSVTVLARGARGDAVVDVQSRLAALGFRIDPEEHGRFGPATERAVREFQKNVGMPADGIVGATTVEALRRLRPVAPGPGRADVREGEALRRLSASIEGARVAIDAGHGPSDPGAIGPTGLTEAEAT